MLAGGFDAWQFVIGERGVYKFPAIKEKKSWFKSTTSISSVSTTGSSSNSVYDYVGTCIYFIHNLSNSSIIIYSSQAKKNNNIK
jgi:hypothetical protein